MLSPTILFVFFFFIISSFLQFSSAATTTDAISQGQIMNSSQTIVSSGGIFELGFFSVGAPTNYYLGIWYKQISISNRTIVWVSNKDRPLSSTNSSCFLTINKDGNLVISDGNGLFLPQSNISPSPGRTTTATLLDSSNFVLRDASNLDNILWQSFDYLSDTFLPEMKLGFNRTTNMTWILTSWRSLQDPSPGKFTTILDPKVTNQFLVMDGSQRHWTSGPWNGQVFSYVPEMATNGVYNFSFATSQDSIYFFYTSLNKSFTSRFVMDVSGKLQQYSWSDSAQKWILVWEQPRQQCDVYSYCGAYSDCDQTQFPYCQCLDGFQPTSQKDWSLRDWSSGCSRRTDLECGNKDGFILMPNMSLPLDSKSQVVQSSDDCKAACLGNCNCTGYSYSNQCQLWYGGLYNVKQADVKGGDLYLRLAASDVKIYAATRNNTSSSSDSGNKSNLSLVIALPVAVSLLIFGSTVCYICMRKRKQKRKLRGKKSTNQDLLAFDFSTKAKETQNESSKVNKIVSGGTWDVDFPLFSLASVAAATNNFNEANKLGQGGFGPVYKGVLLNGQEVAIKRLSRGSGQGLEELKNETTLIAKLQHRNLVRLLGCCIEDEEKILIYEYMSNKSLDLILFDPNNRVKLSWERRICIIEGIAQGLLYLHQYSRLRIIHRDLKASNILLDGEMNPKISDFGMARIFGGNVLQANTNRIVGTYGYMSPEYAMEGLFSIKSDVFSFGVLLLEILSGRKNTNFYLSANNNINLVGHAWNLWKSERGLEFMDPTLGDSSCLTTPLRYIHVALLCVQEKAIDRPTMSEVIAMLSNELIALPSPKQPGFSCGGSVDASSSTSKQASSINDVTVSLTPR